MNGSVRGYVADISLKGCEICDNIVSLKKNKTKKQSQVLKGTNQAHLGPHFVFYQYVLQGQRLSWDMR